MSNRYWDWHSPVHLTEGHHGTTSKLNGQRNSILFYQMQCHRSSCYQQRMVEEAHSEIVGCRDINEYFYVVWIWIGSK